MVSRRQPRTQADQRTSSAARSRVAHFQARMARPNPGSERSMSRRGSSVTVACTRGVRSPRLALPDAFLLEHPDECDVVGDGGLRENVIGALRARGLVTGRRARRKGGCAWPDRRLRPPSLRGPRHHPLPDRRGIDVPENAVRRRCRRCAAPPPPQAAAGWPGSRCALRKSPSPSTSSRPPPRGRCAPAFRRAQTVEDDRSGRARR